MHSKPTVYLIYCALGNTRYRNLCKSHLDFCHFCKVCLWIHLENVTTLVFCFHIGWFASPALSLHLKWRFCLFIIQVLKSISRASVFLLCSCFKQRHASLLKIVALPQAEGGSEAWKHKMTPSWPLLNSQKSWQRFHPYKTGIRYWRAGRAMSGLNVLWDQCSLQRCHCRLPGCQLFD